MVENPIRIVTDDRSIRYQALIDAPAAELFSLLANPHRHHEIDGSGTVRPEVEGPQQLAEGDFFSVAMKLWVPYTMRSMATHVTADELVEWRHPAGHRWRWEFSQQPDGKTLVTESWIFPKSLPAKLFYQAFGAMRRNDEGIRLTLERLQKRYGARRK